VRGCHSSEFHALPTRHHSGDSSATPERSFAGKPRSTSSADPSTSAAQACSAEDVEERPSLRTPIVGGTTAGVEIPCGVEVDPGHPSGNDRPATLLSGDRGEGKCFPLPPPPHTPIPSPSQAAERVDLRPRLRTAAFHSPNCEERLHGCFRRRRIAVTNARLVSAPLSGEG